MTDPLLRVPPELDGRLTLTVPEAARYYGVGRTALYEAVGRGDVPSLRIGARIVIPIARMLEQLGVLDAGEGAGE